MLLLPPAPGRIGRSRFGIRFTLMSRQLGATDIPLPLTSTLCCASTIYIDPGANA